MGYLLRVVKKFQRSRIVVVDRFNEVGGADYPILNYIRYLDKNDEEGHLVRFMDKFGSISLLLALFLSKKILVNGLRPFHYWRLILFVFFKKNVVIYLHETDWVFRRFREKNRFKYLLVSYLIKNRAILCVSSVNEEYVKKTFGAKKTHLVYNNIGDRYLIEKEEGFKNILMVGSIQERKGVSFFSELADFSLKNGEEWRFYWVGDGRFGDPKLYFSKNVKWLGYADPVGVDNCIKNSHLFFLASVDDPFPLSCLETLYNYKKCVVFTNTGTAEILTGLKGCAVFQSYTVESAYDAIKKALAEDLDLERVKYINEEISSVSSFAKRLEGVF